MRDISRRLAAPAQQLSHRAEQTRMCVFQAALGALLYVRANAASVDSNAAPQGSDAPNLNSWWARVLLAGTAYFGSIAGSHQVSFTEMDQLAGKIETAASSQQLILVCALMVVHLLARRHHAVCMGNIGCGI
jgi:hypothetical protein|eukprot:COSAG01_NODE_417_length_17291_cov_610.598825_16_plen_132_part_00